MIDKILEYYNFKGIHNIVASSDVSYVLNDTYKEQARSFKIDIIDDVRSATFFANGISNRLITPIILLVSYDYITNCYTGLTEACFQQLPVILIAVAKPDEEVRYNYLHACLRRGVTIDDNELNYDLLDKALISLGPSLIIAREVYCPIENHQPNQIILDSLNNLLTKEDTVFIYSDTYNKTDFHYRINIIRSKYKYGIISKYFGYSYVSQHKSILIIPMEIMKLENNIFQTRYKNGNIKVILLNYNKDLIPEDWLKNNSFELIIIDEINQEEIASFVRSDKPAIMIISKK